MSVANAANSTHTARIARDGRGMESTDGESIPFHKALTRTYSSSPNGIRTRAATLRGWCPRPLDDGAKHEIVPLTCTFVDSWFQPKQGGGLREKRWCPTRFRAAKTIAVRTTAEPTMWSDLPKRVII